MVGVQLRRRGSRRQMVVPAGDDYEPYPRKLSYEGDGPAVEPIISLPPSSVPPIPPSGLSRRPTPGHRDGNDWMNQYYMPPHRTNSHTHYHGQTITTTPHLSRPSDAGKSKHLRSCLKKQLSHKLQKKTSSSSHHHHHHPPQPPTPSPSPQQHHHKTNDVAFVGQRVGGHRDLGASFGGLIEDEDDDDEDDEHSDLDDEDEILGGVVGPEEEWSNGSSRDTSTTKTSSSFSDSGTRSHGGGVGLDDEYGGQYDHRQHHSYDHDVAPLRLRTASGMSSSYASSQPPLPPPQSEASQQLELENASLRQELEELRRQMMEWKQEQEAASSPLAAAKGKTRPSMVKDANNKAASLSTMSSSTSSLTVPSTTSLANSNEPLLEEDDEGEAAVPTTLSSVQSTSMSTTASSSFPDDLDVSTNSRQSATGGGSSTSSTTTAKSMKDAMKGLLQVTQRQERTIASLNNKVEKLRAENAVLKKQQCREIVSLTHELNRLRRGSNDGGGGGGGCTRSRCSSAVMEDATSVTSFDDKVDESLERLKVHMQETISMTEQRRQKLRNRIRERERRVSVDVPSSSSSSHNNKESNLDNLLSNSTGGINRSRAGSTSSAFTSLLLQEANNLRRSSVQEEGGKDRRVGAGEGGKASRRKSRRTSSKESSSPPTSSAAPQPTSSLHNHHKDSAGDGEGPSLSFDADFSDNDEDYFTKNATTSPSSADNAGNMARQRTSQSSSYSKKKTNVLNTTPPRRRCRSPTPSGRAAGAGRLTLKKQTSSRSMKKQPSIRLLRARHQPQNALAASANTIEQAFPKNPRIFRGDSFFGGFDQFYNDDNVHVDDEEDDDQDIEIVEEEEEDEDGMEDL